MPSGPLPDRLAADVDVNLYCKKPGIWSTGMGGTALHHWLCRIRSGEMEFFIIVFGMGKQCAVLTICMRQYEYLYLFRSERLCFAAHLPSIHFGSIRNRRPASFCSLIRFIRPMVAAPMARTSNWDCMATPFLPLWSIKPIQAAWRTESRI